MMALRLKYSRQCKWSQFIHSHIHKSAVTENNTMHTRTGKEQQLYPQVNQTDAI